MSNSHVPSEVLRVAELLAYLDRNGIGYTTMVSPATLWRDLDQEARDHYRTRAEWFLVRFRTPMRRASQPGPMPKTQVLAPAA